MRNLKVSIFVVVQVQMCTTCRTIIPIQDTGGLVFGQPRQARRLVRGRNRNVGGKKTTGDPPRGVAVTKLLCDRQARGGNLEAVAVLAAVA